MNRREFLISALAFSTGLKLSCCQSVPYEMQMVSKGADIFAPPSFNLEDAVGANKLLIDFPNKLPGAKSVHKYITPGARHCLVHVRYMHWDTEASKSGLEEVKKVQAKVYNIVSHLIENHEVNKIYLEGLTPKTAPIFNVCAGIKYISKNPESVYDPNFNDRVPEDLRDLESVEKNNPVLFESYSFLESIQDYHFMYRLASETDKFEVLASEDVDTYKKSLKLKNLRKNPFWFIITELTGSFQKVMEERENHFLGISSRGESPLSVVIFGHYHRWENNIQKWNSQYPDYKFSRIEVTPIGL